jgi:2-oxoglutarate ferredoxin oxidoreductase subunit beta
MAVREAARANGKRVNAIGLERIDYKGNPSTLCKGCGHDSISARIIEVTYELSLPPTQVIKMSGIGCSSKSPAYWLGQAHGFNGTHGRMPSITTGAILANHKLTAIAVSGDGDTGNIGMGQFKHLMRRNLPMVYIVENNGVYGLTKGQFSATADEGQESKYYGLNEFPAIDLCVEAIVAECTFVARTFAGDPRQVNELLKAAISHKGTALLDIISPCVTFNNHYGSTKSYSWGKEHEVPVHDINYVAPQEEIQVDYKPGEVRMVAMHDGSLIQLRKLAEDYDPTDRMAALRLLDHARANHEFVTGLLYVDRARQSLIEEENLPDRPLARLPAEMLRPPRETLESVMAEYL